MENNNEFNIGNSIELDDVLKSIVYKFYTVEVSSAFTIPKYYTCLAYSAEDAIRTVKDCKRIDDSFMCKVIQEHNPISMIIE